MSGRCKRRIPNPKIKSSQVNSANQSMPFLKIKLAGWKQKLVALNTGLPCRSESFHPTPGSPMS